MTTAFTAALAILLVLLSHADLLWLDVGSNASVSDGVLAKLLQDECRDTQQGWQDRQCSISMLQLRHSTLTELVHQSTELPRHKHAKPGTAKSSLSMISDNAAAARTQVGRQRNAESCPQEITSAQVLTEFGIASNTLPKHAKVRMCEAPTDHGGGIIYIEGLFDPTELKSVQQYLSSRLHHDDDVMFWQQNNYYDYFTEGGETEDPIESLSGRLILDRLVNVTSRAKPGSFQAAKDAGHVGSDGVHQAGCVHHDRNLKPERTMTVLAYIEAPSFGGHTAFPTVRVPGRSDLSSLAEEAAGIFPANGQAWSDSLKLCYHEDILSSAARVQSAACEHFRQSDIENTSYNEFFGIAPVPGDAVIFRHFLPRTSLVPGQTPQAEWNHFHNGCAAFGPRSKVAVQYFAEG